MNRPRSQTELDLIAKLEELIALLGKTGNDGQVLREMESLVAIIKQWRLTGMGEQ